MKICLIFLSNKISTAEYFFQFPFLSETNMKLLYLGDIVVN